MEEPAVIRLRFEDRAIEFKLEMHRNNKKITNLNELPVSVNMKEEEFESRREFESTISNQKMVLREWIKHFVSFSEGPAIDFDVGSTEFDIQTLRNTLPKVHCISLTCSKDEPDEDDHFNAQNFLRAFLPDVRKVGLDRVPLQANLSLQHIGAVNLQFLGLEYQSGLNLVDISTWNFEKCMIWTMSYQKLLFELNRFFKLWIKGSNPRLNELGIEWDAEITPDWNVLLKGLKAETDKDEEEEDKKYFTIQNNRDICAIVTVRHSGDTASVYLEII
ncbi:hypothetical protein B9Z55_026508 [Caenorhabditis nigoni]|uniref:Sdz-33 F-box domain-containing protein n=1 Tax=Caenorhabditis nigoni TaxID=1611254 RepID=A0A2G5T412_9PELO|nr:hypothetical protein B9Z55_026508 [Caenorhabditis nigoni]